MALETRITRLECTLRPVGGRGTAAAWLRTLDDNELAVLEAAMTADEAGMAPRMQIAVIAAYAARWQNYRQAAGIR
jgi:hypothetical protein